MPTVDNPLDNDQAKGQLKYCLSHGRFDYTNHFRDRLAERDLSFEDVLFVCRAGAVISAPEFDTQRRTWKYRIDGSNPGSSKVVRRVLARPGSCRLYNRLGGGQIMPECAECSKPIEFNRVTYRYTESGLSNVLLEGVDVAECKACGTATVSIPRIEKVHRVIALALAEQSPGYMTGEQFRFLRKHLEMTGEKLAGFLHTDRTKISKWETGEDKIGPSTDRLVRLLVTALDDELRPAVLSVAQHIPQITDEPGTKWELYVNVETMTAAFVSVFKAA
jgi:DNA-binding transcriptional regulator YiaG